MVRRRLTRKQTNSRPDNVWPDMWEHMSDAAKSEAIMDHREPKLDNARQLRGIFFIEPDDGASKLEIQRHGRIPRWLCKRWFRIIRSIHWTRIISITNDGFQSDGQYHQDFQDAQDKHQTQYPPTPRSKWKTPRRCWKFQSQNARTFGFVYHDTIGLNHGPVRKTQSFLLNEICAVILWQDYYGKAIREKSIGTRLWKKFQIGNAYSLTEKKDYSYLYVDENILAGMKQNIDPVWTHERRWFGRPDIFLWPCLFGLYSKRMSNKQRCCRQW